jgi:hypothetical protein
MKNRPGASDYLVFIGAAGQAFKAGTSDMVERGLCLPWHFAQFCIMTGLISAAEVTPGFAVAGVEVPVVPGLVSALAVSPRAVVSAIAVSLIAVFIRVVSWF